MKLASFTSFSTKPVMIPRVPLIVPDEWMFCTKSVTTSNMLFRLSPTSDSPLARSDNIISQASFILLYLPRSVSLSVFCMLWNSPPSSVIFQKIDFTSSKPTSLFEILDLTSDVVTVLPSFFE